MNSKILLSLLCLLFLFSCKKEHQEEKEVPRYPVRFDLTGFTQTQQPIDVATIKTNSLTTNTGTDTIPVNQLFYFVYGRVVNGAQPPLVAQKIINRTDAGFGVFTDDLPAGNYDIYFVGSSVTLKGLDLNGGGLTYYPQNSGWGDTFYKKIPITVTSTGINQTVQMERRSAQIVVNILDAIPANVTKIEVKYDDYLAFYTNNTGGLKNYYGQAIVSKPVTTTDIGVTNFKVYANTIFTNVPAQVSIAYYTTGTSPSDTKTVTVTSQPNKRTVISGKLFSGNNTFNITFDDWNTPVTVGF